MKKHLSFLLIFCLLAALFTACSDEKEASVVTIESTTTESEINSTEDTSTELIDESSEETTEETTEESLPYETAFSSLRITQDSDGNDWLSVLVAYENTGDTPLFLNYSTMTVYADDEEIDLEDVAAYPQVIAPGETGYYFEQVHIDFEPTAASFEINAQIEPTDAETTVFYEVQNIRCRNSAFGLEVSGELNASGGLVCVCAILFDADGNPVAVLSDYLSADETGFVLSGDKVDLTAEELSDCVVYAYPYDT